MAAPFCSNELCSLADVISPEQVRGRIEVLVKSFLTSLMDKETTIYPLEMVSRSPSNTLLKQGLVQGDNIFLSHSSSSLSFTKPSGRKRYFRVWKILELCYQLLGFRKKVTQRELFYRLLSDAPGELETQRQVNNSIQDVVAILKCSRYSLGILASSRGVLTGRVILEEPNREVIDCTNIGIGGHVISGDFELLQRLVFKSDARYILVIEKDAIFQRLAEDRFFQTVPSILLTAKGYPDLASRVMLHRLNRSFPLLPIIGLVDWNPCGLGLLCTYKFGSISMGLEAPEYVCDVKWLGLRAEDLAGIPPEAFGSLSERDRQVANGLLSSKMLQHHEDYKAELQQMLDTGVRVEIEALYAHGYNYLSKYIARKIVQMRYI